MNSSDYIDEFLSEGDPLRRGGFVGYRQVGVRLNGDYEMTGSGEDLASLGQALVDRFGPLRQVLLTGSLADGFTLYGPTGIEDPAAQAKIADLEGSDAADVYRFQPLEPLTPRFTRQAGGNSPIAELIERFRTTALVMYAQYEEADRKLARSLRTGAKGLPEADYRQDGNDAAKAAVYLAYEILLGVKPPVPVGLPADDASDSLATAVEMRGRATAVLLETCDHWNPQPAAALFGIVRALLNGSLPEQQIDDYPAKGFPVEPSEQIARAAGLPFNRAEGVYGSGEWITAESIGLAIEGLRMLTGEGASVIMSNWSHLDESLMRAGMSVRELRQVLAGCRTVTDAARLLAGEPAAVPKQVTAFADKVMAEVRRDVAEGIVPRTVTCFSHLHAFVDANMYSHQAGLEYDPEDPASSDLINAVEDEVSRRMQAGALLAAQPETAVNDQGPHQA
ncbi:hypothetical protein [Actinoplanes derwentensis]|uniref:Uncharacterized protein n=1 Tax=Actinoplanes derwentensis TaxID=113562 RepID=A0A1H2CV81_9ACTN|nr:hypothetical protein [Actinoplanes derwentensis]GID81963.1 hypothetical protein Ade03nite_08870 [Actinoplanes derwentensis]SDT74219.1 hypothetical protein SAMN04489716_6912 [Actinoplanes derwentensis]